MSTPQVGTNIISVIRHSICPLLCHLPQSERGAEVFRSGRLGDEGCDEEAPRPKSTARTGPASPSQIYGQRRLLLRVSVTRLSVCMVPIPSAALSLFQRCHIRCTSRSSPDKTLRIRVSWSKEERGKVMTRKIPVKYKIRFSSVVVLTSCKFVQYKYVVLLRCRTKACA